MKKYSSETIMGILLIGLSALSYLAHYLIFRDFHHITIYLVGDIAFVFLEVLLVTMIFHRLLESKEKRNRLEKLNMVIGAFYSEIGIKLLSCFSNFDPELEQIRKELIVTDNWTDEKFNKTSFALKKFDYTVNRDKIDLKGLKEIVTPKKDFFLRLLENPTLLEHEAFTDLLMSVFHLTEELSFREDLDKVPEADIKHLIVDIERVYVLLVNQWIEYMKYLKNNYPYLFSLAIRTNPFDQKASVIIKR